MTGSRATPSTTSGPTERPQGLIRFGPGVPPADAPAPGWGSARTGRGRRRRRWSAGLLTLGVVAGVLIWLLLHPAQPLTVTGAHVTAAVVPGTCDTTADVVGTVTTDGHAGMLRYQWIRSDGQRTEPQVQTVVAGETSTPVHLEWSVSGHGRLPARATLRVLEPTPTEASGDFTYSCP